MKTSIKKTKHQDKNRKPKVLLSKSQAIQKYLLTDKGTPFDFVDRPYWHEIYNSKSRYKAIQTSRQVGKSLSNAADVLIHALGERNKSILYCTATEKQLSDFRTKKILKQFAVNKSLKVRSINSSCINNADLITFINNSSINFRAIGQNVDSARGLVAERIYLDEAQDIPEEHQHVVMESATTYKDTSAYIISGTPKGDRNIMNQLYLESSQNEWIIYCPSCGEDNPPLGMDHIDIEKPYLFCSLCKQSISMNDGRWVAQNPESTRLGYRMCELMKPECTWSNEAHNGILDRYDKYSQETFLNEVMGLPYFPGEQLINLHELEACCSSDEMLSTDTVPDRFKREHMLGAIDWSLKSDGVQHSYTIFSIAYFNIDLKIEVVFVKRFYGPEWENPDTVLDEIARLAHKYHVKIIATDWGVGHKENLRLRPKLSGIQVFEIMYNDSPKVVQWDFETKILKVGKTSSLDLVFHHLRKGLFRFPQAKTMQPYFDDILNVYEAFDIDHRKKTYKRGSKGSDDFLQLLNYFLLLSQKSMQPGAERIIYTYVQRPTRA